MPDRELCGLPSKVQWVAEGRKAAGDSGAVERGGDVVV